MILIPEDKESRLQKLIRVMMDGTEGGGVRKFGREIKRVGKAQGSGTGAGASGLYKCLNLQITVSNMQMKPQAKD